jgi:hypothetical protein
MRRLDFGTELVNSSGHEELARQVLPTLRPEGSSRSPGKLLTKQTQRNGTSFRSARSVP